MSDKSQGPDVARYVFWIAVVLAIFLLGGVFGEKNLPPYSLFSRGLESTGNLVAELSQERHGLVRRAQYQGSGVTRHNPTRTQAGYTLIQGLFPEGVQLQLIDIEGNILRNWPVYLRQIWPDPAHIYPQTNVPIDDFHYHTQGLWALPDGSVLFNLEGVGTVKMDRCGEVQWTIDRMTHHSITANADGSFWIPVRADLRDIPDELMLKQISPESLDSSLGKYEDRLLLVSADGEILEEISVLEAYFDGGFEHDLFDGWKINLFDPTHVNDIEVVTPALANKIEGVEAGDLLVSVRQLHMLIIMDRDSGEIKWHRAGPWVRQHDPDITASGNIEVFNNGGQHRKTGTFPGSSVMVLDPATGVVDILVPQGEDSRFYTAIQGTHQALPNGNRLITESMAGRLFETDPEGNIVWEYIRQYDDKYSAVISEAIRYDEDYFQVDNWTCAADQSTD